VKFSDSVRSEKVRKPAWKQKVWASEDLEKCDVKALQQIEEER